MRFAEWEPTYLEICRDFGIDPASDESAQRVLEAVTPNLDLDDEDCIGPLIGGSATVFGAAARLEDDIRDCPPEGTLIAAGSACGRMMDAGFMPDILVTDLDGDIGPQVDASRKGAVTLILAHGDNTDLVRRFAPCFRGKVVLTTQNRPRGNVLCFGGFSDGDRAVCLARHFGARRILLLGFDYDNPFPKDGSDPLSKSKKLAWARRIIGDGPDVVYPPVRNPADARRRRSISLSSPSLTTVTEGRTSSDILSSLRFALYSCAVETMALRNMMPQAAMALMISWQSISIAPRSMGTRFRGAVMFLNNMSKRFCGSCVPHR